MSKKTLTVFDPAMCCSTGVCGPSVDPRLAHFSADLAWLESRGVAVQRFNLSQQPGAFADDATVKKALEDRGDAALPLIKVGDQIKSSGVYPSRQELGDWAGVTSPSSALDSETDQRVENSSSCCGSARQADPSGRTKTSCC